MGKKLAKGVLNQMVGLISFPLCLYIPHTFIQDCNDLLLFSQDISHGSPHLCVVALVLVSMPQSLGLVSTHFVLVMTW